MTRFPGYTLIYKSLLFGLLLGTASPVPGAEIPATAATNSPPPAAVTSPATGSPQETGPAAADDQTNPTTPVPPPVPAPLDPAVTKAIEAAEAAATAARVEVAKAAQLQYEQNEKLIRANLMLQEQLHEAVGTIERNRDESNIAVTESANAVDRRLQLIESAINSNRDRDLEAAKSSNHLVLVISAIFASVGLIALLAASWFQLRAMNRFAELTANHFTPHALPPHRPDPSDHLEHGWHPGDPHAFHEPGYSSRLGSVIESLEHRVRELEHTPHGPLPAPRDKNGHAASSSESTGTPDPSDPASDLILKGQSLLNADEPEKALACFQEILDTYPKHTDAWLKKGTALERLKRLEQALDCYDHAIAADETLTLAYLYKGGVFNQLERFNEALECYEQALRSQDRADTPQPSAVPGS